jgi:Response regulators consisting of a CheY-like receiver domain and a winged-helix DNA-binding domain
VNRGKVLEILIVEDDEKLNNGIRLALKNESYTFSQCRTLKDAREVLRTRKVALILLDVNLPDGNGIDFVREVRAKSQTPVLLITVNNMELDIVTGLEAGANDYITKPFSLMVLRARVAVWLREREEGKKSRVQIDGFDFDFDRMEFYRDRQAVELSKTEQKLLRLLCENRGATLKRSYLIDSVWQGETEFVDEHALTVAVKRLRDKLEADSKNPDYIKTVYGIGYTWAVKN